MNKLQGCKQLVVVVLFSNTWPSDLGTRPLFGGLTAYICYIIVVECVINPNIPNKSNILVHIPHLNSETKK